ncbi:uncharacterized protein METZ01_LOCUS213877, partial [marine metagenome]
PLIRELIDCIMLQSSNPEHSRALVFMVPAGDEKTAQH